MASNEGTIVMDRFDLLDRMLELKSEMLAAEQVKDWGWRSCVVYTNEVISKIWRTNDAMLSLRSS